MPTAQLTVAGHRSCMQLVEALHSRESLFGLVLGTSSGVLVRMNWPIKETSRQHVAPDKMSLAAFF
jgi:hypothetical protein